MRHHIACVVLAVLAASVANGRPGAQGAAGSAPSFEVASIRQNRAAGPSSVRALPNGTLVITNNTAWNIIRNAYGLSGAQIVGAPGWLESDRFDITAKAAAPFAQPEGMAMLRALLAERFALAAHMDRREMPVYLLLLASKDGRLGPSLHRVDVDCAALFASVRAGGPMPPGGPNGKVPCSINVRPSTINGAGVSMSAPSLFAAMQDQLGLKLEPGRAPIDVLVIDRVERPTV